jgi:hypothetical protein
VAPSSLRRRRPSGRPWPRARPRWCPPAASLRGIVGVAGGIDLGRGSRRQPRAWSWRAASMQSQLAGGRHRCRAAGRGRPGDMDGQRPAGICRRGSATQGEKDGGSAEMGVWISGARPRNQGTRKRLRPYLYRYIYKVDGLSRPNQRAKSALKYLVTIHTPDSSNKK